MVREDVYKKAIEKLNQNKGTSLSFCQEEFKVNDRGAITEIKLSIWENISQTEFTVSFDYTDLETGRRDNESQTLSLIDLFVVRVAKHIWDAWTSKLNATAAVLGSVIGVNHDYNGSYDRKVSINAADIELNGSSLNDRFDQMAANLNSATNKMSGIENRTQWHESEIIGLRQENTTLKQQVQDLQKQLREEHDRTRYIMSTLEEKGIINYEEGMSYES